MSKKLPSIKIRLVRKRLACFGVVLVVAGILGAGPGLYYQFSQSGSVANYGLPRVAANPLVAPAAPLISGKPRQIIIDNLSINLPVADGYYNPKNGSWTLSRNQAHFALPSTPANNKQGMTFIYGHNRSEVFSRLAKITPGSTAMVITDNNYRFTYRYVASFATNPKDTAVFGYGGPPILVLQTCSGAWFQNRQLFQFDLLDYQPL